tara:strand:+ start:37 stop:354 length:318 start_codon:yes stop_codon:yes gene_type:complete
MSRNIHRIKEISVDISKDYADINIVRDAVSYSSATTAMDIEDQFPDLDWFTIRDIIEAADDIRLIEEEVDTLFYHDDGCNIKVTKDDETLFTHGVNFKTKLEVVK